MEAKPWLTVKEVAARLAEAGYLDSLNTIRRAVDIGRYGVQGVDWYRTDAGYRMIRPAAVEANIRRRQAPE